MARTFGLDPEQERRDDMAWANTGVLAAMVEQWTGSKGNAGHAKQIRRASPAQWSRRFPLEAPHISSQLIKKSAGGEARERAIAFEALGAMYFNRDASLDVLDATQRGLADPDHDVAMKALVALTNFNISAAQFRDILRRSPLIKGRDISALLLGLNGSSKVRAASASALGVLHARNAKAALHSVEARDEELIRNLAKMAGQQIDEPSRDDRLPWMRHFAWESQFTQWSKRQTR
jgi:hypothetical protein